MLGKIVDFYLLKTHSYELEELEKSLTAFSYATRVPVTCFNTSGTITWECSKERKICSTNKTYCQSGSPCTDVLKSAMSVAEKLGEAYIFECRAGLIKICYPLFIDDKIRAFIIAGPILMGDTKDRSLRNFYKNIPLNDVDMPSIAVILNNTDHRTPKEVAYISTIFSNSILSAFVRLRPGESQRQITKEHDELATKIIQMKEADLIVSYPSQAEAGLIAAMNDGDIERSKNYLYEYLEKIMVFDAGNLPVVKVRLLNIFSKVTYPENEAGNMYENSNIIRDISNADDMKTIFEVSKDFVLKAVKNISENRYHGNSHIITQAIRVINSKYSKDINLTSIAKEIHVNPSYLSSLFRREMDISLIDYLTNIRLASAERLLTSGNVPISDIAFECGFRDPNYFSRLFKRKYGLTPRDYRGNAKEK